MTFGLEMYGQHCLSQYANLNRYWTETRANLSFRAFWRHFPTNFSAEFESIFRFWLGISRAGFREGRAGGIGFGVFSLLPGPQRHGTQRGEVGLVALVDRGQRQVGFLDDVVAAGHRLRLFRGARDHVTAWESAHPKLLR